MKNKKVLCAYCGGNCRIKFVSLKHPDWIGMENIDMYECARCKSLTTYPMPSKEKLMECYSQYVKGFPKRKSDAKENSHQEKWYKEVLKLLRLKHERGKKIADVGAGEGLFTKELLKICENCNIDCFDLHAMPPSLKNLQLKKGNSLRWIISDVSEKNWRSGEQYDLVVCNAVLEHVPEPKILVDNLLSITKKSGTLFILAPCIDAWAYRILQKKWVYIIPGEHLSLPSLKGLRMMMQNYSRNAYILKKISPVYSVKYIFDSMMPFHLPSFLDVSIPVPTGSFMLAIRKK